MKDLLQILNIDEFFVFTVFFLSVLILYTGIRQIARTLLDKTKNQLWWELLVKNAIFLSLILHVFTVIIIRPYLKLTGKDSLFLAHLLKLMVIGIITFVSIRMMLAFSKLYLRRYNVSAADNLKARKIHTQVRLVERIGVVVIIFVGLMAASLTFPEVRQFGVSILASAGVVGIILGFAAQKSLSLVFAGIQIAITQPIRLDDAVFVENEWGWIEEITLTYVVVRLWDRRRLVLPINYFIENPFQNWTKNSADLLGTVFVYLDYSVPIDEIRKVTGDIVKQTPLWNGEVCVVQITEFLHDRMEIRILATANSSPETFDLRCFIREELLKYLKENYPGAFPRIRIDKFE